MLVPAVLSIVAGVAWVLAAAWIAADTGVGSGFRGYTGGHRLKMAFVALFGLAHIGLGIWLLFASS